MRHLSPVIALLLTLGLAGFLLLREAAAQQAGAAAQTAAGGANVVAEQARANLDRYRQLGWVIPDEVDPQNSRERMLLLLPGGPLLVELTMTIDGAPYGAAREALVDQMYAQSDTDGDGVHTWPEAMVNPRFSFGRYGAALAGNEQARKNFVAQYDLNRDGVVDRTELRWFLSASYGGPALLIANTPANYGNARLKLKSLLDVDGDGVLTGAELKDAFTRLKTRDSDDNDIVSLAELFELAANGAFNRGRVISARGPSGNEPTGMVWYLGTEPEFEKLHAGLVKRYGTEERLPVAAIASIARWATTIDENGDGYIALDELRTLASIRADLDLICPLGKSEAAPAQFELSRLNPEFGAAEATVSRDGDNLAVRLPGCNINISLRQDNTNVNLQRSVDAVFQQFDKDKNGYLELSEYGAQAQAMQQQFAQMDADEDGKVFSAEMLSWYERMQAPARQRVSIYAQEQEDPLHGVLDQNHDLQIGLREMHSAATLLQTLDKNQNGELAAAEVPDTISLVIGQGMSAYQGVYQAQAGYAVSTTTAAGSTSGPAWFTSMDRNGDGDVSPREFPGEEALFTRIDRNRDGLIDAEEAAAADASTAEPDRAVEAPAANP